MTTNLLSVIEQQHKALERMHRWADSQADAQSKGGHATFDLMQLREERDAMIPAIAAGQQAMEQTQGEAVGWKLVPVEPTKAMRRAGADVWSKVGGSFTQVTGTMYRAMLAVAPAHPQATEPAPNPWKDAVLNQIAAHCMDAPLNMPPADILKRVIDMAVTMATDPAISEPAPSTADQP